MSEMVVIIRPSFKRFCGGDACQAALFNHLLYWIAQKAEGQEKSKVQAGEAHWYGTAEEICAGLDHSWSINKVRKELKALKDAGLVGQTRNPVKGWDQTRHYFIGSEQGTAIRAACEQHGICLLHLGLRPDVLHLLTMVNAFHTSGKCSCQMCEMDTPDLVNERDKNGDWNPQIREMDVPNLMTPFTKSGNAIPKDNPKVSLPKDTEKENQKEEKESTPSVDLSSDQLILSWLKELRIPKSKDPAKVAADLALLVTRVHAKDDLIALHTFTQEHIYGENKTVFLGNLAGSVEDWGNSLNAGSDCQEPAPYAPMNEGQAEAFARSLLSVFPAELLGIDKTYPNDDQIWSTCIQYAPEEWVYFENEEHYNNPSAWERGCIEQAQAWGRTLASQRAAV